MKRRLVILSIVLVVGILLTISASAHTPLLSVEDNEDGTIYLEGGFSDGSSAAGVTILLVEDKPYESDPKGNDLNIGNWLTIHLNNPLKYIPNPEAIRSS